MATTSPKLFRTQDVPFAAYLRLSAELRFHSIEPIATGLALFLFFDPNNKGPAIESDFIAGKTLVNPSAYYHTYRLCLREAKRASKENGR